MKLRFEVDQAACFRDGIDCPKSIVVVDVNPKSLHQKERDLIADRMDGIDVCHLVRKGGHLMIQYLDSNMEFTLNKTSTPVRIIAKRPDFQGLISAALESEQILNGK